MEQPKTASEVAVAAVELQREVAKTIRATRIVSTDVPGWREVVPTMEQVHNLVRMIMIESLPGMTTPYILPNDSFTRITVVDGSVTINDLENGALHRIQSVVDAFDPNLATYLVMPGTHLTMLADAFPTQVLLLSWRRHARSV